DGAALEQPTNPDNPVPMLRLVKHLALALYCIAIFLTLDFAYSSFLHVDARSPRQFHPIYNHGFVPNFEGYDYWGDVRYKIFTNSLGLRDASVRDVPAKGAVRRVMLMGDSFTEGTGVDFEDSFAGMLHSAGMARPDRIEFLAGGVVSYSPTIYYRKTKFLMEQ